MLDLSKLENVLQRGGKTIAACPACRSVGADKKGNHLFIKGNDGRGKYGCVAHPGDGPHRKEIFDFVGIPENREFTPEEKRQWMEACNRERLRITEQEKLTERIQEILESKLTPYLSSDWQADLWHASPLRFDHPEVAPFDFIASLFQPNDILWLGKYNDRGKPEHAANFQTCRDWLRQTTLPPRVAAGTFQADSFSRCKDNVINSPYLILESDHLIGYEPENVSDKERNKALSYALIGYAQDKLGLTLRAVIDTGNKSLHAWFDRPPEPAMNAIRKMQAGLRLDDGVLENAAYLPMRMHGCIYDDKTNATAKLLYLNPISP